MPKADRSPTKDQSPPQPDPRLTEVSQTAGIAHDLCNLLSVMLSNSSELIQQLADGGQRELAAEIHHAATRSAALARQLISDHRDRMPAEAPADLNRTIAALLPLLERTAGERATVSFYPDPRLPAVALDIGAVERILLNLVTNSRDALVPGGRIDIRTALRCLTEESGRGIGWFVQLEVSDDGRGMEAETAARAGERFFTTRAEEGGTGIGLASIHELVEAADGAIRVISSPQRGTTVQITLPAVGRGGRALSLPPRDRLG